MTACGGFIYPVSLRLWLSGSLRLLVVVLRNYSRRATGVHVLYPALYAIYTGEYRIFALLVPE